MICRAPVRAEADHSLRWRCLCRTRASTHMPARSPFAVAILALALLCSVSACSGDGSGGPNAPFRELMDRFDAGSSGTRGERDAVPVADASEPDAPAPPDASADAGDDGDASTAEDVSPADTTTDDTDSTDAAEQDADATDASDATDVTDATMEDADATDTSVDVPEATPSPSLDLSLLVVAPNSLEPEALAAALQGAVSAHPDWGITEAQGVGFDDTALFGFFYRWTGRAERLAPLSAGWDVVVLVDGTSWPQRRPELHFEGVRAAAALARDAGSVPVLAIRGGERALGYRVAQGIEAPVLPAEDVLSQAGVGTWGDALAATFARALTGEDAVGASLDAASVDDDAWAALVEGARIIEAEHRLAPQYEGPFEGVVRLHERPLPETYRFLISGTSSERGYRGNMDTFLDRQGIRNWSSDIGICNPQKRFDEECLERARRYYEADAHVSLYARNYSVDAARIAEVSGQPDLRPQIYERHWSDTRNDAVGALDDIERRSTTNYDRARSYGLDWLPMHLNFARLKIEYPDVHMLSDSVHATNTVLTGIAAMSFVSATGQVPITEGYSEQTTRAIELGELTIRQLATLSASGVHRADSPGARPTLIGIVWDAP